MGDLVRRRPPGHRLLVYLDQSARSRLADGSSPALLSVLQSGREKDLLVCPESSQHGYETTLTTQEALFEKIATLGDELSMGVRFLSLREIESNEIFAAAAAYLGKPPPKPCYAEALSPDPHARKSELFPIGDGVGRITFEPEKIDWLEDEAGLDKRTALELQQYFDMVQFREESFEERAALESRAALENTFAPILRRARFERSMREAEAGKAKEFRAGNTDGPMFQRLQNLRDQLDLVKALFRRYPELLPSRVVLTDASGDSASFRGFVESSPLSEMPAIRYSAHLMAGLLCIPKRKAKAGDVYDLKHLRLGLSRCDYVTADGGMEAMCRHRRLIPDGVRLYRSKDLDTMATDIKTQLRL